MSKSNLPYILLDGTICLRDLTPTNFLGMSSLLGPHTADSLYVKSCKPKYIKFNDGHRLRYDPTKHTARSGQGMKKPIDLTLYPTLKGSVGKAIFRSGKWWKWNDKKQKWIKQK